MILARQWFWGVLALCFLVVGGCTINMNEVDYVAELPDVEQPIDLRVELRLTDAFRNAQCVHREQGFTWLTPIGKSLSHSAEVVARTVFKEVIVNDGTAASPAANIDAVLIPSVAAVTRDRPATAFQTQTTTAQLIWTLERPDGSPLWKTTIAAVGKGRLGAMLTDRDAGTEQVRALAQDAAEKSLDRILSASVIRTYADSR